MIKLLLLILFVEAVTEILVESSIFQKPREFVYTRNGFLGELVTCGYCTSVWVSAAVAWLVVFPISPWFVINYIITVFVIDRLSNLLHELNNKWLNRRPFSMALHKTETVIIPGEINEPRSGPQTFQGPEED